MAFRIVVPESIFGGWAFNLWALKIGILYHSLQSDQRWIFLIHWHSRRPNWNWRFGYRTKGDAKPEYDSYNEWGWHWPWKYRLTAGRG
jgi:hypothetical protein